MPPKATGGRRRATEGYGRLPKGYGRLPKATEGCRNATEELPESYKRVAARSARQSKTNSSP
eukprot:7035788-Pyramimonas_sp.AAC.1